VRAFPFSVIPQNDDEKFMLEALKEAWKAYQRKEVPVGAVLVHKGRVIARGHNQVEMLQDATAHAEMLCITAGETALENWRLLETTLYCTVEPCCMCAGAMLLSRVSVLVWGAKDLRHGANGSWINVFSLPHPTHSLEIRSGIYQDLCADLMRSFFRERRSQQEEEADEPGIV
jgi:tRNA(adenine34) deaminase